MSKPYWKNSQIELSDLEESGFNISYNASTKEIVLNGWTNYINPVQEQRIKLEDFVLMLELPFRDIKYLFPESCFNFKFTKAYKKRKKKPKSRAKKVYSYKFKWNRKFIALDLKKKGVIAKDE